MQRKDTIERELAVESEASGYLNQIPVIHPAPARNVRPRYLVSQSLDLWLIGGFSILVYVVMMVASAFRGHPSVRQQFSNISAFAGVMALFINYPHFMVSYKIAYARGARFILKNWFQLIFVPVGLIAAFTLSYFKFSDKNELSPQLNPLNFMYGEGIVSLLISLMFLTVGWHYVKQTFGCMLVYGSFADYRLQKRERRWLLGLLASIAFFSFLGSHIGPPGISYFYGFRIISLGLPVGLYLTAHASFWILAVSFIFFVLFKKWRAERRLPPPGFIIPLIALVIWWLPIAQHPEYFLIVPLFHSLQYLPFAYRYERGRNEAFAKRRGTGTLQIAALVAVGYFAFELGPYFMNQNHSTPDMSKMMFMVVAAHVFINVHHYFIDNTIWKFHQPEIQSYLLGLHAGPKKEA